MIKLVLATSAGVMAVLSALTIVPAPTLRLLPLGIAVPEWSPILLALSLAIFGGSFLAPVSTPILLARICAASACVLCAWPLVQIPGTLRRFDAALEAARPGTLGPPTSTGPRARSAGLDLGDVRSTRGVSLGTPGGQPLTVDIYQPAKRLRPLISRGAPWLVASAFLPRFARLGPLSGAQREQNPRSGAPSGPGEHAEQAAAYPVLVQIYGGAWQRGTPADDGAAAAYFAARGWVVFAIDYRHAPQWRWPAQRDDVRAALAWIRANGERYGADLNRIALLGRSAGAQLALIAAYQEGAPSIAAVVSYYGPTNLEEGWRVPPRPDPLGVRGVLEAYLGGTPDDVPDAFRAASPVHHVSPTVPPTLLIYGSRDHIVEARFGRQLHERLRAARVASVLLELPWSEHAFDAVPFGLGGQISLRYVERFLSSAVRR